MGTAAVALLFAAAPVVSSGQTAVYYSVGTNTGDLKSATVPTVSIAAGVATFSVPQPDNVGVGDEITYNGVTIAYISGRTSSTTYSVTTATGAAPTPGGPWTVNSIKRAFNSLYDATRNSDDAGHLGNNDLTVLNVQLNWPCYNDALPDSVPAATGAVQVRQVAPTLSSQGWVTGPGNGLRIYTPTATSEVGVSQRHVGRAGTGYRLAPTGNPGNSNYNLIYVARSYVSIEGLEIDGSLLTNTGNVRGINVNRATLDAYNAMIDVEISHNLIYNISNTTDYDPATNDVYGIRLQDADEVKAWNNIVYNLTNASTTAGSDTVGIMSTNAAAGETHRVFNNTVYNLQGQNGVRGIWRDDLGDLEVKNNYVGRLSSALGPGSTLCYSGTFLNAASDNYNVSSDATASGTGSQTGKDQYASYFVRSIPASADLHLVDGSSNLWGSSGADLDSDLNLPVTDDIDGTARDASFPDIGADEFTRRVYRSVGINGANLNTVPRTVQISGTTATFSGPMPDNVGVGDVLTYASGGNRLAFIVGRTSSSVFTVKDKNGDPPTATGAGTPVGVYRAYTSLANWEAHVENPAITEPVEDDVNPPVDLVASNIIMMVPCYADGEDVGSVFMSSWTTGPANYIKVYTPVFGNEVGASQRHDGKWDTTAYRLSQDASAFAVIRVRERYVRIDGLQLNTNQIVSTESNGIHVGNANADAPVEIHISNNIVRTTTAGLPDVAFGIGALSGFGTTTFDSSRYVARVWNNVVYGFVASSSSSGIYVSSYGTMYAYNNTVVGVTGTHRGIAEFNNTIVHAKNNISIDAADPYQGGFAADSTNNVSDTGDAPPTGARNCEPTFVNKAGADYHLDPSDTCAADWGANLSADAELSFATDIDTTARQVPWDIGADDVAAATAVTLVAFEAAGLDGAVELSWETGSEIDNLGFQLYRSLSEGGPYERITAALIPGLGSSPVGARYSYRDAGLANGVRYYYELEDVETTGATERHGPVAAVPQRVAADDDPGEDPGEGEASPTARIAYGNPEANALRILRRGSGGAVVELVTEGFYAVPQPDGTVLLEIPDFELSGAAGTPAVPIRRTWVEAVAGRRVELGPVRAAGIEGFAGLRPSNAEAPRLDIRADGTLRAGTRRARRAYRHSDGLYPPQAARILEVGFQAEVKKALLELSPLRWDEGSGQLLLARRLEVRVSFRGRDAAETARGGSRGRRRPRGEGAGSGAVLVRLATREAGLYGVDFEELFPGRRRGFRTAELRLSRQGEAVAFHVEPDPKRLDPGSRLFFVSEGGRTNPHSNEAVYELEAASGGLQMALASAPPLGPALLSAHRRREWEESRYYMAALLEAPDLWLWDRLFGGQSRSYAFEQSALAATGEAGRLELWLQGGSDLEADPDHHVRLSVNGLFLTEASWDGRRPHRIEAELPPGVLVEGANHLELVNVGDTGATYTVVYLDRFAVGYPGRLEAQGGVFAGRFDGSGAAALGGLDGRAVVVDLTDAAPRWLSGAVGTASGLSLRVEAGHEYLAAGAEGLLRPEVRPASPSDLRATSQQADYLVVGPRAFLAEAEPLLRLRREQGLSARGVAIEEVFDEFGHGEPRPEALRDFLAYAYHSWKEPSPRYVVLLGDATFDPKDLAGTGVPNPVPTVMFESSYLWTASDPAFAAVNGEDALPDLALGRLPASTPEEARALVEKIVAWETGGGNLSGPVALVADDADGGGDFEADAERVARTLLSGREVERIYLSRLGGATRSAIHEVFHRGASLISYLGHGSLSMWASENLLSRNDIPLLQGQRQQPLVLTMNCLNGYFLPPATDSLSEALILAEGKGAIAVFSPSGLSLHQAARRYHEALVGALVSGAHERLGDALLDAQVAYAGTGAMPELLSLYHLFGDPALRLR